MPLLDEVSRKYQLALPPIGEGVASPQLQEGSLGGRILNLYESASVETIYDDSEFLSSGYLDDLTGLFARKVQEPACTLLFSLNGQAVEKAKELSSIEGPILTQPCAFSTTSLGERGEGKFSAAQRFSIGEGEECNESFFPQKKRELPLLELNIARVFFNTFTGDRLPRMPRLSETTLLSRLTSEFFKHVPKGSKIHSKTFHAAMSLSGVSSTSLNFQECVSYAERLGVTLLHDPIVTLDKSTRKKVREALRKEIKYPRLVICRKVFNLTYKAEDQGKTAVWLGHRSPEIQQLQKQLMDKNEYETKVEKATPDIKNAVNTSVKNAIRLGRKITPMLLVKFIFVEGQRILGRELWLRLPSKLILTLKEEILKSLRIESGVSG